MNKKLKIVDLLLDTKAVNLSPNNLFTWVSGIKSPIYTDNRLLYSNAEALEIVSNQFVEYINTLDKVDLIVGVATSGIGWGAIVANKLNKPFAYVRSKPKDHGTKKMIEGLIKKGDNVVVIEDLVSKGNSSFAACKHVMDEGAFVASLVSIFTYDLKSANKLFKDNNLKYHSLISINDILNSEQFNQRFNEKEQNIVKDFIISLNK